jgi:hypothetical protein
MLLLLFFFCSSSSSSSLLLMRVQICKKEAANLVLEREIERGEIECGGNERRGKE